MLLAWERCHFSRGPVPYVLRSKRHYRSFADTATERKPHGGDDYAMNQVVRATPAAPFYFKAVNSDKEAPNLE